MILVLSTGVNGDGLRMGAEMDQYASCCIIVIKVYNFTNHEVKEDQCTSTMQK